MNKKIPFSIALIIIFLIIIITALIIILRCPLLNEKEKYSLPKQEIKDDNVLSCVEHGVNPQITSEECFDLGGEVITMHSGICCFEEDFLGTVVGLKCPCICCKENKVKIGNPAFIDVRLMGDWAHNKNNELGIWVKNLQEPSILSIDIASFYKEEVIGVQPIMEYKFLLKGLPIIKRIDEDGFYKLMFDQNFFSNEKISHWEVSVYLSDRITMEPTRGKSIDPILFPIKDIFPDDLLEDSFYLISSYRETSLINYILSPIELFYVELDDYHGLFNYISEDKIMDKVSFSIDNSFNIETKIIEDDFKISGLTIYPNPIIVGDEEIVRFSTRISGGKEDPEKIELIEVDQNGNYLKSWGFLEATSIRKYEQEFKVSRDKEKKIFFKVILDYNNKKYQSSIETFNITNFPIGPAPFDENNIIINPDNEEKLIKNRIIIGFEETVFSDRIREIISNENSKIVGTILSFNSFQVEFETEGTVQEVYDLIERFNQYEEVRYAEPDYIIELDL